MTYFLIFVFLVVIINVYFKIALTKNIIDAPNHRSSHSQTTIRGAGIIFYISLSLTYFYFEGISLLSFLAITVLAVMSFVDDMRGLSAKLRLPVQIAILGILAFELAGPVAPWYSTIVIIIGAAGFLNVYNFMDGINGITTIYSAVFIATVYVMNQQLMFVNDSLLVSTFLGLVVFGYYNIRIRAKCFLGDVGSVTLGCIVLIVLCQLIYSTKEISFLLLTAVYFIDGGMTILVRLWKRENIFEAHRTHLYQLLTNEKGYSHIGISLVYAMIQLLINFIVISNYHYHLLDGSPLLLLLTSFLLTFYCFIRFGILPKMRSISLNRTRN